MRYIRPDDPGDSVCPPDLQELYLKEDAALRELSPLFDRLSESFNRKCSDATAEERLTALEAALLVITTHLPTFRTVATQNAMHDALHDLAEELKAKT